MTHYRLMLRFGKDQTFTYESIMAYDTHVRSRKEGQGVNLSWRFDSTTRHVLLKDYVPKERAPKAKAFHPKKNTSTPKKSGGVCFDWIQSKPCKFKDNCKFLHACTACDLTKPQKHDISKCSKKDALKTSRSKNQL